VVQERSVGDAVEDGRVEFEVNARLLDRDVGLFGRVATEVVEGRVLLTGVVPTEDERITAAEIAWSVPGVREVINELEVDRPKSLETLAGDVVITQRVRTRLLTEAEVRSYNFNIETVGGVVHLIGLARSPRELRKVTGLAATVPGVRQVVSHVLTIDDPRRTSAANVGAGVAG
jgi:osmotically-inducible protein OsmY